MCISSNIIRVVKVRKLVWLRLEQWQENCVLTQKKRDQYEDLGVGI